MSRARDTPAGEKPLDRASAESLGAGAAGSVDADGAAAEGLRLTRRSALIGGALGFGGVLAAGAISPEIPGAMAATVSDPPSNPITPPTTTAPEQLRLLWGADPATEMTISWSAPGSVPMPAPMLAFSPSPITAENPGEVVFLPQPTPLDPTGVRSGPCVTSFLDGGSGQTTYHYHVPLTGLEPDTTYYYEITDGADPPSSAGASFQTAPKGRAAYRFTAFGDQGTSYSDNPSGVGWTGSTDTPLFTTQATISPGDGAGPGLFHLMIGDLTYANGFPANQPAVWRDWQTMVSPSSQNRPWLPVIGNHENEQGATNWQGTELDDSVPSAAYYNGPYGCGNYLARFLLPDYGVTNWDGNSLQGHFYSFQIGTVFFIGLSGMDVTWQGNDWGRRVAGPYTGTLSADPSNMQMVPSGSTPNLQTQWLEQQLQAARAEGSGVEMIVVFQHFPAASVDAAPNGNGCDMGIRTTWGPLFDQYEVDLVLTGHNHNYLRSYPARGYDPPSGQTTTAFTNAFGTYTSGATIDTRRPTTVQTDPVGVNGQQVWDTGRGTVYFVLGGGGRGSSIGETTDPSTGAPQGWLWSNYDQTMNAWEDASWLALYDTSDAYGYAVFDVDPGDGPGQTAITFQWFQMPFADDGQTVQLPTVPLEKFVFMRLSDQITPGIASIDGNVRVGRTVSANPGTWSPTSVTLSYQWLLAGTPITGATSDTYEIAPADLGQELQVQITGTLDGETARTVTSSGTTVAASPLHPGAVTVSGTPVVGGTVTADATTWTPAATLTYQWLLDGEPISDATETSYSPVASDAGHLLEVRVTGSSTGYETTSVTSVPQLVVAGVGSDGEALAALAMPSLSAAPVVGETISADLASGTPAAGIAYQWLLNGSAIRGATTVSYTPVPADADQQLQIEVTAGAQSTRSKAATVRPTSFRAVSRPGLRGTPAVGGVLAVVTGRWSPNPAFAYQWLVDGEPIRGATRPTLMLTAAHAGRSVSVRVVAERTGYLIHDATSRAVRIRKGTLNASAPRITGKARIGDTLHVINGTWAPLPKFGYRWLVGGHPVHGATGIAYKVRPQDRGKRISVEVTGRKPGYDTTVKTSAATFPVRGQQQL